MCRDMDDIPRYVEHLAVEILSWNAIPMIARPLLRLICLVSRLVDTGILLLSLVIVRRPSCMLLPGFLPCFRRQRIQQKFDVFAGELLYVLSSTSAARRMNACLVVLHSNSQASILLTLLSSIPKLFPSNWRTASCIRTSSKTLYRALVSLQLSAAIR